MTTLAKLVVKLITDVSEFEAGMKNAAKKMDKIGQTMTSIGTGMTVGLTLPLLAVGAASIKMASDLNESMNKVDVVFGDSAGVVRDFSKTSAKSLGMSQNAALTAMGTFGNLFTSMGMGKDKAADMSTNLTQLAADLASFNNLDPSEVFQKLQSGMVGETEPLRALGINLMESTVKAKAMEMGLGDASGALTDQEKILARYAIIMDQTKNAQGDFARTSDGMANSARILKAEFENTLATFGQTLLPTATAFMQALIPILEFFNNLPAPVKTAIVYFLMFVAALGPIIAVVGKIISAGSAIAAAFGTGGALAGAGTFITATLLPALGAIGTVITGTILPAIAAIALPVVAVIAAFVLLYATIKIFGPQALETIKTIGKIFALLPQLIGIELQKIGPAVVGALRNAAIWVIGRATDFYRAGQALITGLINGIISYATYVVQVVMKVVQSVIDAVKKMLGIHSPSSVFTAYGQNMMLGLERGIDQFSAKPVLATVQATGAAASAAAAIQPGGNGRSLSVGPIVINGDLSSSQKERLKAEMQTMFVQLIGEALQ